MDSVTYCERIASAERAFLTTAWALSPYTDILNSSMIRIDAFKSSELSLWSITARRSAQIESSLRQTNPTR
jgi:hypothetical protein